MVFGKDKQNEQISGQAHQEEKRKNPNKQNKKVKRKKMKTLLQTNKNHRKL